MELNATCACFLFNLDVKLVSEQGAGFWDGFYCREEEGDRVVFGAEQNLVLKSSSLRYSCFAMNAASRFAADFRKIPPPISLLPQIRVKSHSDKAQRLHTRDAACKTRGT